jgi:hypothetical protein
MLGFTLGFTLGFHKLRIFSLKEKKERQPLFSGQKKIDTSMMLGFTLGFTLGFHSSAR